MQICSCPGPTSIDQPEPLFISSFPGEHLPPQGGETPAKPEQPITSPPAKDHPRSNHSLVPTNLLLEQELAAE